MNTVLSKVILCGKGRLGLLIAAALQERGCHCEFARIDAERGLVQNDQVLTGNIDTLILCLVPKHTDGRDGSRPSSGIHTIPGDKQSGWQGLLQGLHKQVQSGSLSINRVLFISSTSVYEKLERGFVNTQTPVSGNSVRAKGLLEAEAVIPQLAASSSIFRLTGLVGPGYDKYDPLSYSQDKPRQAVDIRAVAADVTGWFLHPHQGHHIEVLTDGLLYWQGKTLDPARDGEQIKTLATQYRLLVPSIVSF